MSDSPILYIRVKKARKVNIKGAMRNSYSSSVESIEDCDLGCRGACQHHAIHSPELNRTFCDFLLSASSREGEILPFVSWPGTFLRLRSCPSDEAPEARLARSLAMSGCGGRISLASIVVRIQQIERPVRTFVLVDLVSIKLKQGEKASRSCERSVEK